MEKLFVYHSGTGELGDEIGAYQTLEQIEIKNRQREGHRQQQRKEQYKMRGNRPFVSCFHESIKEVNPYLSLTESGAVMKLLLYMKMNSEGLLQKHGKPLKQKDIQKILRKGERQTREIIKRLVSLSILKTKKVGRSNHYYINEHFHVMGKHPRNTYFTKILTTKLCEVVEDSEIEELGFLYKLLPYFHYDTCVLAHNPNVEDEKEIQYMNRKELAIAINYDVDNITTLVKRLRKKGLIMTTNSSGNVLYYVHPDLMYRQANDGYMGKFNALRSMFKAHQFNVNKRTYEN